MRFVSIPAAVLIGAIGGVLVVFSVLYFDRLKIDDPVGSLSVHLVNGIWGTLAVGLFASKSLPGGISADGLFNGGGMGLLISQLTGVASVGVFTCAVSAVGWLVIKATLGLRVSEEVERMGLDMTEMGMEAYRECRSLMRNVASHPECAAVFLNKRSVIWYDPERV